MVALTEVRGIITLIQEERGALQRAWRVIGKLSWCPEIKRLISRLDGTLCGIAAAIRAYVPQYFFHRLLDAMATFLFFLTSIVFTSSQLHEGGKESARGYIEVRWTRLMGNEFTYQLYSSQMHV